MIKRTLATISLVIFSLLLLAPSAFAQDEGNEGNGVLQDIPTERRAQTTMKFLGVSPFARAAALGNAMTAVEGGATSIFYNVGALGRLTRTVDLSLSRANWFAGFSYNGGAVAYRPGIGNYGVFGVFVRSANYGDFLATVRADNEQGYMDVQKYSPSGLSVGISYARALTTKFSVGGNVKYARQSLGQSAMKAEEEGGGFVYENNTASTPALDLGVHYRTGYRSLKFAVSMRNLSPEVEYREESVELPLTFRIGAAMDMTDFTAVGDVHDFVVSLNAERPRDFEEHVKVGGEYLFANTLFLRAGYAFPNDAEGVSLGGGLQLPVEDYKLAANYAYTQFGMLGNIHRFGIQLGL